jgi:hypothetical protein
MSYESNIAATDFLFAGEDKTLSYEVFAAGSTTVMEDVSAFALQWDLRRTAKDRNCLISKTTAALGGIAVTGVYDAARATNTQRVLISIADTDTENVCAGTYFCSLKRMDAGLEGVLSHGTVVLQGSAVW